MKKSRTRHQPAYKSRVLDPRKGPKRGGQSAARIGGKKQPATLEDYKPPIVIALLATVIIGGWIFTKPMIHKRMDKMRYNICLNRLKDLQAGLNKYATSHNGAYGLYELYTYLGKGDNESAAAWVSDSCAGPDGKYWTFIDNLKISSNAKSYVLTGTARTKPLCKITMTPDVMWPYGFDDCGKPPPASFPQ